MNQKSLIVSLLFLFFIGNCYTASITTKIDSLKNELRNDNRDTTTIDLRLYIADLYGSNDRGSAYSNIELAIDLAIEIGDKQRLAASYEAMGNYHNQDSHYIDALRYFMLSEKLYIQLGNTEGEARQLNFAGIIYGKMGDHYDALTVFNRELYIRLKNKDPKGVANVYNNLGNVYLELNQTALAEEYYLKALDIYLQIDNAILTSRTYNNLGLVSLTFQDYTRAEDYFRKSLSLLEDLGEIKEIGNAYINLAYTFTKKEILDSADVYFQKAEIIVIDQSDLYNQLHFNLVRVDYFIAHDSLDKALDLANMALQSAKEMNLLGPQKQAYENLYRIYSAKGDFEEALNYHEKFVRIDDSIEKGGNLFELSRIQLNESTDQHIIELEKAFQEVSAEDIPFWNERWFVIFVFFLLLGTLIFILEFRRKNAINKVSDDYQNIDYLRSTRILYLLASIMFMFLPMFMNAFINSLYDPIVYRVLISAVIMITYLLTFWSSFVRNYIDLITKILYIVMISYTYYLMYMNSIHLEFFLQLLVILSGLTIVFKKLKEIIIIGLFLLLFALILFVFVVHPQVDTSLFIITIVAVIFVSIIAGLSRLDLDQHLEFSNEVVRHADALVFIVNRKGENIYTSHSVKSILGFTPQELREHDWIERIGVDRKEAIRITNELILIAIGTIEPSYNPYQRLVAKNGNEVWMSFKEKRLSNNRVLIIGIDITEQKKIQDELATSEQNFRQINETLSDVFYLYNLQDEKYEYISPNSAAILGPTPQFFYDNQNYIETYVLPEDRPKAVAAYAKVKKGLAFDVEYKIKIGKELKWIREKSHPVFDKSGRVNKNAGLCQDITERKKAEQEIQKLSLIASNTDNFILMVDHENRVEWANRSFYNLTKFKEEDVIGKLPLELISGPLTSERTILEISQAIFEDKRQMQCELVNYKADGSIFYSAIEVTPLLDLEGNFEKYFVIGSDISQRIADQEQIEKLSLVASNTSNYIIIAHAQEGIEWVNRAFTEKFGYSLEEVQGLFPSEFLHDPSDPTHAIEKINEVVFQRLQKYTGEVVHLTKSGKGIYANVDITPLMDETGKIEKYFVLGVDISERKRYEEEIELANADLSLKERLLNESERNFIELIRSIKEVFYLRDLETGEFIFVSDSYSEVFGQSIEELKKDPASWKNNIHPEDKNRVIKAFENAGPNNLFNEDFRLIMPSGEQKWVNSRVFEISDDQGKVIKISGFTEDITEKKQQELEIQKIADQLDIIHSIEKTILHADSTEAIIYNTLEKTIDKLPIVRASLKLFDPNEKTYKSYARVRDQKENQKNTNEISLNNFSEYEILLKTKKTYIKILENKQELSPTEELMAEHGAQLLLMAPLLSGDRLIGSLNVCFEDKYQENLEHFVRVTNEVANGLAIAIQQSQLKDKLHLSNRAVNSSIEYAKMIQQAYIPANLRIGEHFKNHFIINRPKDIVSGDFYWTGEYGDTKIIAVGDCTGHGVPGAFMTIIGISELENIVIQQGVVDPAKILNKLNSAILKALSSRAEIRLKDGMDIGIFAFNTKTNEVLFEGARRPLYQISKGELVITDSTKLSIGDSGDRFGLEYISKSISHKRGDIFYLFSDGITDQFGGERQRKFSKIRLENCINECKDRSLKEQEVLINKELNDWQGNHYQTDDMVLVAFSIFNTD